MCRLHWCLCVSLGSLSQAALKHLLTSPLFPTWQFSQQLNCVHDYTLPASMALPSSQNGKEREPGKAGPRAGKGSAFWNNPAQMLTEQAGSQQHLREVTVLVDWFVVKFPHYPSKLSFPCTACDTSISATVLSAQDKAVQLCLRTALPKDSK